MSGGWRAELRENLTESRLRFNAPLKPLTTLRVGGPAECLLDLESEGDLAVLMDVAAAHAVPVFILGKGSNVLVPDAGLPGVVMRLGKVFQGLTLKEKVVRAGAGTANAAYVEQCRKWGLGGMEFLIAVPGTIGGAIAMNAGAHDGETAQFLRVVRLYRAGRGFEETDASTIPFAYRSSPLRGQEGCFVVAGEFALAPVEDTEIRARMERFHTYRRETQPRDFPNCGSVFKNPPGTFAAKLIEEAGLKGKVLGGAQVSEKHANFIVNRGQASAAEICALVDFIRETVYSLTQIELELELQVL